MVQRCLSRRGLGNPGARRPITVRRFITRDGPVTISALPAGAT
ncbi:hypothetical protein [Amycolatopsis acidicola]|nr:hypothetical protein [Amycolatopsis acidicola]